ncbi:hypothetical protein DB346_14095 [Verrucomicrobia bacterium LW23]|nr:hypothetical protein DB346_14095 [Verrucomicrobia bacterium LW23]
MLFQPCFSSLGCPDIGIEELCAIAVNPDHRIPGAAPCIEIRSLEGTADYPGKLAESPEALRHAVAKTKAAGIEVRLVGSSLHLSQNTSADLAALLKCGRVADAFGARYVRVFGGGSAEPKGMSPKEIAHAASLYIEAVRYFESEGINAEIVVETHGRLVTADLVLQLCDQAAQPVPLLWDTHHTWKIGGESLTSTYTAIAPLVRHMHGKDSRVDPQHKKGYRYMFAGEGEFPFAELFALLQDTPPEAEEITPALSLEWELMWNRDLPPLEPALSAWMRKLAPHLNLAQGVNK